LADIAEGIFRSFMVGMVTGTIYGLIGIGIVLIFKAQRVINFAQAEIATMAAFMLLLFHSVVGLPYLAAMLLAVLSAIVASVIIERVVIRALREAPPVTIFVVTAGVALFIIALTFVIAGANILIVDPLFGGWERLLAERPVLGLVSPQRLLVLGVLVGSAIGLAAFFSRSALGKAILAMSAEPFAVRLAGISTNRMSMFIWALAGLLLEPLQSIKVFMRNNLNPFNARALLGPCPQAPDPTVFMHRKGAFLNVQIDPDQFFLRAGTGHIEQSLGFRKVFILTKFTLIDKQG
jgi:branched-subunit amino acid ABC-type transport system permease component